MQGRRTSSLVVTLGLGSLLLAQAVCFAVIWWLPRPPAPQMHFGEAVRVLQGQAPAARYGLLDWLQFEPPEGANNLAIAAVLAAQLQVPSDDVRVVWVRPETAPMVRDMETGETADIDGSRGRGIAEALLLPGLRWPAFMLAMREGGDYWRVVTVAHDDTWRRHMLLALGAGAIMLAPLIAWAALRLTRPLSRLAAASASLGLRDGEPLPEEGPREVRMLARAMNAARTRLKSQADDITRMLAAVAHDLRTPLTGLRLRAEMAPPDQAARMVEDIARMNHMVDQVLAYASGELGPARREPIALRALLEDCVQQARLRGIRITADLADLPEFTGDESLLRRALANLVDNAARYAGSVELSAHVHEGHLVIDVADRGPGIADADKVRLLQPFERNEASRNRATGGIGLGLSVAQGAAHRHRGELLLLDRPGGGLVARLCLPCPLGHSANRMPGQPLCAEPGNAKPDAI